MSIRRVHVLVRGRVQGVFFRDYTRAQAEKRQLGGWVRNLPDMSVEAVFEGAPRNVEAMLDWLKEGSPLAAVDSLTVTEQAPAGETGFVIRY